MTRLTKLTSAPKLAPQNRYASLLLTGRELIDGDAASPCGREKDVDARAEAIVQWNSGGAKNAVEQLELAVQDGSHGAAYMLATLMLSGLGGTSAQGRLSPGTETLQSRPPLVPPSRAGKYVAHFN